MSPRLGFLARALITALLLWLVLRATDSGALREALAGVAWIDLMLVIVLGFFSRIVLACRWLTILRAYRITIPSWRLIKTVLISNSLGFFSPGNVAADIVRTYSVGRLTGSTAITAWTVALDRLAGVAAIVLVGFLGSVIAEAVGFDTGRVVSLLGIGLLGLLVLAGLVAADVPARLAAHIRLHRAQSLLRRLDALHRSLSGRQGVIGTLALAFLISVAVQLVRGLMFFLLFRALGSDIELIYCLMFAPIVYGALMLPVTIGGFGLREGVMVLLFGQIGVPAETSITAGLLLFVVQICTLLPGFALFLLDSRRHGEIASPSARNDIP